MGGGDGCSYHLYTVNSLTRRPPLWTLSVGITLQSVSMVVR